MGSALPLVCAIFSIPYLLNDLGNESFGILTLAWALIGYLSLFDLGIGKALTYYLSIARDDENSDNISLIFMSSLTITIMAGLIGAILLCSFSSEIVSLLKISETYRTDAELTFIVCGLGVLPTTLISAFRGAFEGFNNFLASNIIKCLIGMAMFLLPVLTVSYYSKSVWVSCAFIILFRVAICVFLLVKMRHFLTLPRLYSFFKTVKIIFKYCFGILISSLIGPLMVYGDRFFVSAYVGASILPIYAIPQEGLLRILIFPTAYTSALFPALAATNGINKKSLYDTSFKRVALGMLALCVSAAVLCFPILSVWISEDFANSAYYVCLILIAGIFVNSISLLPATLIQASGNTKAIAYVHSIELVLYIASLYFLTKKYGIEGAAIAWLLRQIIDFGLLYLISRKYQVNS